jgi:hypothetical protein
MKLNSHTVGSSTIGSGTSEGVTCAAPRAPAGLITVKSLQIEYQYDVNASSSCCT